MRAKKIINHNKVIKNKANKYVKVIICNEIQIFKIY